MHAYEAASQPASSRWSVRAPVLCLPGWLLLAYPLTKTVGVTCTPRTCSTTTTSRPPRCPQPPPRGTYRHTTAAVVVVSHPVQLGGELDQLRGARAAVAPRAC